MKHLAFAKGHGTENSFVVILDRHKTVSLTPELVRDICDRHRGVGVDGLVRAVKAEHIPEWSGDQDIWFMDYWNPDGSYAEMCGNGLRVFVRFLLEEGLVAGDIKIGTRAGLRMAWERPGGLLRCEMGPVGLGAETWLETSGRRLVARAVDVGNPHAVVVLPNDVSLADVDLRQAPMYDAEVFPKGVNAEFVMIGPDRLSMRVFERGAGETRSCGTGVVAAAAVAADLAGLAEASTWTVDVPGGRLQVELTGKQSYLIGPAVIVARGELTLAGSA